MKGLEFDPERHEYFLNGVKMLSVSDILAPLTASMYAGIDSLTLANAARRGIRIHELCELLDYDALPDEFEAELLPYVSAYRSFKRDYRIGEWKAVEMQVALETFGIAGTIDRVGGNDGRPWLLDIKTGTSVDKKRLAVQLTGYGIILSNTQIPSCPTNYKLSGLQLKKDGNYRLIEVEPEPEVFWACYKIAEYLRKEAK